MKANINTIIASAFEHANQWLLLIAFYNGLGLEAVVHFYNNFEFTKNMRLYSVIFIRFNKNLPLGCFWQLRPDLKRVINF